MPPADVPTEPPADLDVRIDRSFGNGPDPFPDVEALLLRGRRLRRRRRAAGGVAVAALVVTGTVLVQPGLTHLDRGSDPDVSSPASTAAAVPTESVSSSPSAAQPPTAAEREQLKGLADSAVTFAGDGQVSLAPGASVVRSMPNPFGATAPAWSRGLAVELRGHEFWYAMSGPGDGSVGGSTQYLVRPEDGRAAFEQFVHDQDPGGARTSFVGPDVWPDVVSLGPVRMTTGGTLVALDGYAVVAQRDGVDVGRAWADPGDETAAALVRADNGAAYFVLARRFAGKPAQLVTVPRAGNGEDLDAFVRLATERYASSGR